MGGPRILAALAQCDGPHDVEALSAAGADEFYLGYVPAVWRRRWGFEAAANRRTTPHQHVLDRRHLRLLASAVRERGGRLHVAFNPPTFAPEQYDTLRAAVEEAETVEPDGYILAGPGPALAFRRWGVRRPFTASTVLGAVNAEAVALLSGLGFDRVVLSPKLTPAETARLCRSVARRRLGTEFELFLGGEGCTFGGDTCFVLHGYGMPAFCRSRQPRRLHRFSGRPVPGPDHRLERALAAVPPRLRCSLCAAPALARLPGVGVFKMPGRGRTEGDAAGTIRFLRELLDGRIDGAAVRRAQGEAGVCRPGPRCFYLEGIPDGPGGGG